MNYNILAINPGSTSTKIAVYDSEKLILEEKINHKAEELSKYDKINDQFDMRKKIILEILMRNNINIGKLSAVVGRGGLLPPVKSGAYLVNECMLDRLINNPIGEHASNLGAIISYEIAKELNINAYIYDSVAVDELSDVARISGLKEIERVSLTHALNSRAMAIKYCKNNELKYKDLNLIVAHLGGGISLSLHNKGKMVDIVSDDEGPFSPERSGKVPCKALVDLCYSSKYTHKEMLKKLRGKGGMYSYLETVDLIEVEKQIQNENSESKLVYEAMIYQIAKGIGELATVVDGDIDAIIITGGIAYSKTITKSIEKKVRFISKVEIMPGENELEALAYGVLRILRKEEEVHIYKE